MTMDTEQLKALAVRVAALTDALEDRSHQAVQAVSSSSERLDQTARHLSQNVQRVTAEATRLVGAEARAAVTQGMQQAVSQCAQALEQASSQAIQSAQALQAQHEALQRARRGLVWRSGLGLLVGAVLATGASAYAFWKNTQAAQSAEFSAAIVRATQSGSLTQCGDVLCVKAPRNAPRYPRNTDYVLLP
jgi:hypothetical protein